MPKRTFQPSKLRRSRRFGFRRRNASQKGRLVVKKRRLKKRARLSVK